MSEINKVDYIRGRSHNWMICALNSLKYYAMYVLYDTLGSESMSLVWICVWNMIGWLVEYWHENWYAW